MPGIELFDVDCPSCGRYRFGTLSESAYLFAREEDRRELVIEARSANETGTFIRLGSHERFPLSDWRQPIRMPDEQPMQEREP